MEGRRRRERERKEKDEEGWKEKEGGGVAEKERRERGRKERLSTYTPHSIGERRIHLNTLQVTTAAIAQHHLASLLLHGQLTPKYWTSQLHGLNTPLASITTCRLVYMCTCTSEASTHGNLHCTFRSLKMTTCKCSWGTAALRKIYGY
jgi:hypothetical protein